MLIKSNELMPLFRAREWKVREIADKKWSESEGAWNKLANVWNVLVNVNNAVGDISGSTLRNISHDATVKKPDEEYMKKIEILLDMASEEYTTLAEDKELSEMVRVSVREVKDKIKRDCDLVEFDPTKFVNQKYNGMTEMQDIVQDITESEMDKISSSDIVNHLICETKKVNDIITWKGWESVGKDIIEASRASIYEDLWTLSADNYNEGETILSEVRNRHSKNT